MKFVILLDMFHELLAKQRVPAPYFAQKYDVSVRTVYRYVDRLSMAVPVYVKTGRNGGICIPETYKLPKGFFTREDYSAILESLSLAYANNHDEKFLNTQRKLTALMRSERGSSADNFDGFDLPLSDAINSSDEQS